MIFVTVGNHYQGFDRLIRKMDEIAGRIDEKVIMQKGSSVYKPANAEYVDFIASFEHIKKLNRDARVVVSHAGAGSIITAVGQGTPMIIVPRLKKFGESIDDHQLELAEVISGNEYVRVVYDVEGLEACIKSPFVQGKTPMSNRLSESLKEYLKSIP